MTDLSLYIAIGYLTTNSLIVIDCRVPVTKIIMIVPNKGRELVLVACQTKSLMPTH